MVESKLREHSMDFSVRNVVSGILKIKGTEVYV